VPAREIAAVAARKCSGPESAHRRALPVSVGGANSIALTIDRAANNIYVANTGSGNLSVIDGASDAVVATIPGEAHPYAIASNEATGTLYVTNTYNNAVTVIDGRTDTAHPLNVDGAD
jgi:YVTN family beta-propeller protein